MERMISFVPQGAMNRRYASDSDLLSEFKTHLALGQWEVVEAFVKFQLDKTAVSDILRGVALQPHLNRWALERFVDTFPCDSLANVLDDFFTWIQTTSPNSKTKIPLTLTLAFAVTALCRMFTALNIYRFSRLAASETIS